MSPPTMLKTMGKATTKKPTRAPPPLLTLEQVLAIQAQML
jgi:hypothetical protein